MEVAAQGPDSAADNERRRLAKNASSAKHRKNRAWHPAAATNSRLAWVNITLAEDALYFTPPKRSPSRARLRFTMNAGTPPDSDHGRSITVLPDGDVIMRSPSSQQYRSVDDAYTTDSAGAPSGTGYQSTFAKTNPRQW
jgi:hypothetical protein